MSIKIDFADKKILIELLKDSRQPIQQIAKKTHLSREIVQYRVTKLEESKIIKSYITRINQSLFCQGIATIMIKLVRTDNERLKEIINYLKGNHSINWFIELCGNQDIIATILYKDQNDLANKTSEITTYIGKNLKEQEISLYIKEYKFDRTGLLTEKENEKQPKETTFSKKNTIKLDDDDRIILSELSKDSRTKIIDIAKKTIVDEDAVRKRIKNLEHNNIINGYTINLDATLLGYESYYLFINLENFDITIENKIRYYFHKNPKIIFAARSTGKQNLIVNIMTKNRGEFYGLLQDIKHNFPQVRDYEINFVMQEHKEVFISEEYIRKHEI